MNMEPLRYKQADMDRLEIIYNGQQERVREFSLDTFTDKLTKSTFIRGPLETIEEARDRIRKGFVK